LLRPTAPPPPLTQNYLKKNRFCGPFFFSKTIYFSLRKK